MLLNSVFLYAFLYLKFIVIYAEDVRMQQSDESWKEEIGWPQNFKFAGQLSAVTLNNVGHVIVFHRGDRIWDESSFAPNNVYNKISQGPIQSDTIVEFNKTTGAVVRSWGRNKFYMPHGITIDHENNTWTTDVALHQVIKLSPENKELFALGEKFVPGGDYRHFCKPTSVAIMKNGDFFIADGYCNSRILKFNSEGKFMMHWGSSNYKNFPGSIRPMTNYSLLIPHKVVLIEKLKQLCVADREHGRVLCYNCFNGSFTSSFLYPQGGMRLFSVDYTPINNGELYVVNGPSPNARVEINGLDFQSKKILFQFATLYNPHDIAVTKDGQEIYVVELNPYMVHKYKRLNFKNLTKDNIFALQEKLPNLKSKYEVSFYVGVTVSIITVICIIYGLIKFTLIYKRGRRSSWPIEENEVLRIDNLSRNIGNKFHKLRTNYSDEEETALVS